MQIRIFRAHLLLIAAWLLMAASAAARAGETAAASADFFEKKIRPVLIEHCYKCHSADAKKLKGGLRLDTRAATRKGGDSGPAIVPGDLAKSLPQYTESLEQWRRHALRALRSRLEFA